MDKPPIDFSQFPNEALTFIWVSFWGAVGGTVRYIQKIKNGYCRFSVTELVGEWVISGFVSILTFLLCSSSHLDLYLSVFLCGVTAHMGSSAIVLLEKVAENLFSRWMKASDKP